MRPLEELAALAVREDDDKDGGGEGGDREEGPEQPLVNYLGQHAPLTTNLVILKTNKQFFFKKKCLSINFSL